MPELSAVRNKNINKFITQKILYGVAVIFL